jgi:HK97 family phage major capsid protein
MSKQSASGLRTPQGLKATARPLMDDEERREFSLLTALRYLSDPGAYSRAAGLELGVSSRARATEATRHHDDGIFVPFEILARDLVVGTSTAGGHLVATDVKRDQLIDVLRPASAVISAGAQVLTDLVGNIAIPRLTGGADIQWVAENAAPAESTPSWDQVTLTPRTAAGYVDVSRRLVLQTGSDISRLVANDLLSAVATAIDQAAILGTGASNQPRGLMATVGLGSVAGGTNGAAPNWDHVVDLEAAVAHSNTLLERPGYVTNSRVRAKLEKTPLLGSTTGTPVWRSDDAGNDMLKGRRAFVSNNVPNNLTKGSAVGTCSAIFYGNWSDMLIGMWGQGVTLMADPYSQSSSGTLRIVVMVDCDIAVRYATSFSIMADALTA